METSCQESLLIPITPQPGDRCAMCSISAVFFNDVRGNTLVHTIDTRKLYATHPRVSKELAALLQIPTLSDLLASEIDDEDEDDDDDDFSQNVNLVTMISSVLRDYSIDYGFNEFVANADDAGASEISFMLDEGKYAVGGNLPLLTPQLTELRDSEGPSLVIHNNSVFTESDFVGFRDVARGSKTRDTSKIGRMGLGSLCMYHWTDNPGILTGGTMMWLDPSGDSLPRRKWTGPRRGFRTSINKISRYVLDAH